jgi:hypothetical protein
METKLIASRHAAGRTGYGTCQPRFEIYRQARAGNYQSVFNADSAAAAVGAFLSVSPAFEGGELIVWNHQEQLTSASVHWFPEKVNLALPVNRRLNVFHDPVLAALAHQAAERLALSETIGRHARMSVQRP